MSKYDIIIAGSGLGGLECGAILSKEGYNVCILEKNPLFGGCLQTFKRKGKLFDTGIHYLGSLDEGQIMNQFFKYAGILDKLQMEKMDKDSFDRILFMDKEYHYAMGHENFIESMISQFPNEAAAIKEYTKKIHEVGNLINIDNLKNGIIAKSGMDHFRTSASDTIDNLTSDQTLRNVLAGTSMLYGGIYDSSTWYHHAMVNNSYIESSYRMVNGTMQISDELIAAIRANGGTVLENKEVTRFIVKDNYVSAVEVNGEEVYEAKNIISNIHPRKTLQLLDKTRNIKNAYINRVKSLPNSYGVFSIYIVLKKNKVPYLNQNIYVHGTDSTWFNPRTSTKDRIDNVLITFQNNGTEYADIMTLMVPVNTSEFNQWADSTVERRGKEYKEFKDQYTNQVLEFLRQKGFDFKDNIEFILTASPLTFRDYMGTTDGAAYGILKDYRFPEISFISTKSKLQNFYMTGQNLNVHGALGVTLTSMLTCAEFLGHECLAKKIGNV